MAKTKGVIGGIGEIAKAAGSLSVNAVKTYGKLLKTVWWTLPYNLTRISEESKIVKNYSPDIGKLEASFAKEVNTEKIAEEIYERKEKIKDNLWKWAEREATSKIHQEMFESNEFQKKYYKEAYEFQARANRYRAGDTGAYSS